MKRIDRKILLSNVELCPEVRATGPRRRLELWAIEDYFQALKLNGTCWLDFKIVWGDDYYFLVLPCRIRISITIVLCLSHHCILRVNYLFSIFISPQMNFASGWITPRISPIHDLHDIFRLSVHTERGSDFPGWCHIVNAFCIWDGHECLGAQG